MGQLTIEQRTFVVKTFYELGSLERTRHAFRERFSEREDILINAIRYNIRKFEHHGTSQNRNKGNSG